MYTDKRERMNIIEGQKHSSDGKRRHTSLLLTGNKCISFIILFSCWIAKTLFSPEPNRIHSVLAQTQFMSVKMTFRDSPILIKCMPDSCSNGRYPVTESW